MRLTVKELKEKIKDLDDDTIVYIERVEDIYFEKHNWETKKLIFGKLPSGYEESAIVFKASQCGSYKDKFVIYAHY